MGHNGSKSSPVSVWSNENEDFGILEEFDCFDLERSTAQNHNINSLGLPDDVLAMIASYCSIEDLGKIARVCKTWRRVSYKDSVWHGCSKEMGLEKTDGQSSVRAMVLEAHICLKKDFQYHPSKIKLARLPTRQGYWEVKIIVISTAKGKHAIGKSCLVVKFVAGVFCEGMCVLLLT